MFWKVLAHSLTRRWTRKAAAVLSVWIGISLVVGLLVLCSNVGDRMSAELGSLGANIKVEPVSASVPLEVGDYQLAPPQNSSYLDSSSIALLKKFFWRNNIIGIAPCLWGEAILNGEKVKLMGLWFQHQIPVEKGEPFIAGAKQVYGYWDVQGRWPLSDKEKSCLLGQELAARFHLKPGSKIVVRNSSRSLELIVVGVVSTGEKEDSAIIAPLEMVQNLIGFYDRVSEISVSALTTPESKLVEKYHRDPQSLTPEEMEQWSCTSYPGTIAAAIQNVIPNSAARVVRKVSETQGKVLTKIKGLMLLLASFSLLACCLSIMGVLAAAILERQQEVSLFQAIGAGRAAVLALFLAEGAIIGGAGGILAAVTGSWIGHRLVSEIFENQSTTQFALLVFSPFLGIMATWAGSFLPVWHALNQETAQVLHGG